MQSARGGALHAASAAEEAGDEVAGEECIVNGSTGDILLLCVRVSGDCIFLIIILFLL